VETWLALAQPLVPKRTAQTAHAAHACHEKMREIIQQSMSNAASFPAHAKGRIWYFLGGVALLIVGFLAIARPGLASIAIAQIIGIFCLVTGGVMLFSAFFGSAKRHRFLDFFSALLRIVVGVLILTNVVKGVLAMTLILAAIFIAEAIFGLVFALKIRGKNSAWIWILLNAVAAFVLGMMLLVKFPDDSAWAIGLLFGINSAFVGVSLIMFALALHSAEEA